MELGIQLATPGLCFVLKKCRFPRRQRGHGKQTFQAKGIAWAKPFFLSIAYNIGSILVILTFHCVNNEFEEQKVGGRIGTRTFCSPFRLQFCSWMWLVSLRAVSLLCVSQQSKPSRRVSFIFHSFWLITFYIVGGQCSVLCAIMWRHNGHFLKMRSFLFFGKVINWPFEIWKIIWKHANIYFFPQMYILLLPVFFCLIHVVN